MNRRQLNLRPQGSPLSRKVEEESSLQEEPQIVPRQPNLATTKVLQSQGLVHEMQRISLLLVNNQSRTQRVTVQMVKVKKKYQESLQTSSLIRKWKLLPSNLKNSARKKLTFTPASSSRILRNNGFWSWNFVCKCWKTGRSTHRLLHQLPLQRRRLLPTLRIESIDLLQPQDLQASNLWRCQLDIRDLVATVSWTELLLGLHLDHQSGTDLEGSLSSIQSIPPTSASLDCASFECHLVSVNI